MPEMERIEFDWEDDLPNDEMLQWDEDRDVEEED